MDFNLLKLTGERFKENLKMIDQIINIGSDVGDLVVSILIDLRKRYESLPAFIDYKKKLDSAIEIIKKIKDHDSLKEKYKIIHNQAIVLLVQNFESFLNDLAREIIDKFPHLITWPEPKKKLAVDVTLLRYSSPSVGDLVLTSLKGEVNFQDLKSTLDFLEKYLNLKDVLNNDEKNLIILGQAFRNIIVHNNNKVDHSFLNQVRDTKDCKTYKDGEDIKLSYDEYQKFKSAFLQFAEKILNKLSEKDI